MIIIIDCLNCVFLSTASSWCCKKYNNLIIFLHPFPFHQTRLNDIFNESYTTPPYLCKLKKTVCLVTQDFVTATDASRYAGTLGVAGQERQLVQLK